MADKAARLLDHIGATLTLREAEVVNELRKWRNENQTHPMSVVFLPSYTLCCSIWEGEANPEAYDEEAAEPDPAQPTA